MADDEKSVFNEVVDWFKDAADWVQENLGDPALAEVLREDLGLAPGASVPDAQRNQLSTFASGMDPDKAAFEDTVAEIVDVVDLIVQIGDTLKADGLTGWDVAWLIGRVLTAESIRARWPGLYAAGKLAEFISDDPESFVEFDPAVVMGLLRGEPPAVSGEVLLQRINAGAWLLVTIGEQVAKKLDVDFVSAYSGWDPDPSSATPNADLVSARAITLMLGPPGDLSAQLTTTILGVPAEHRGPGLFLSFGGGISAEHVDGDAKYKLQAGATGALDLYIPFGGSPMGFTANGDPAAFVRFDVTRAASGDGPAVRVGDPGGTRFDITKLVLGLDVGPGRAAVRMGFEDAALVIVLGEGDGFLSQLPGGEIRVELSLVFNVDSANGLTIEGGTRARATLPINTSLFGVFTIFHIEIALGPSPKGRDLAIELSGGFGLNLGPFKASVDRLGLLLDVGFRQGNLGFLDVDFGFKPPNGVGLVLDAGPVKGGGYLFVDVDRGEYAGALELRFFSVGVKALGILSTRMPDGSDGWALLLLIYGQFPPIQLSWGFTLTGVGGIIGVQHAVSIDALQTGLRDGVLDDILFPADPVADAPRIINRLRTVFPVTPRALTFGPMLEIGWGTPNIIIIRLGVIIQLDNAVGPGTGSLEFSRLVLVGQLRAQLLPEATGAPPLLKLLVDVLGYYDAAENRLGFQARLRDSHVAGLTLNGMLIVQADFGGDPTFVLAAGGFHPRFNDLPPGLPAKIDRLSVSFDISIVKITIEGYFAVTPATVQTGASLLAKAKLGPVSLEGWLGFDAIFYFEPRFHFEVDLKAGVAVKFKGHSLASVTLTMTLTGPGLWRATGKISFSILFWDVDKSFDETIGSAPDTPVVTTNVAALVQAALADEGNWAAQLPPAGASIASIGPVKGVTGLLAHPLGQLQVVQNVAPLGVELQKFGNTRVEGANRFDVAEVRLGSQVVVSPRTVPQSFAPSQFREMSEEDKLSKPSFEKFTAGVAVGTDQFVPSGTQLAANLEYETHILTPAGEGGRRLGDLRAVLLTAARLGTGDLMWQAKLGAAGQAAIRRTDKLTPAGAAAVVVNPAPLAVTDAATMATVAALDGDARANTVLAGVAAAGVAGAQLVEAFEVQV